MIEELIEGARETIAVERARVSRLVDELAACCPPGAAFRGVPVADILHDISRALDNAEAEMVHAVEDVAFLLDETT